MSFRAKLKRYLLILEKLPHRPSKAQLIDHLDQHGLALSPRTLERDLEQLRDELGVEVAYDRTENQYFVENPGAEHDSVVQLLSRAQLFELLNGEGDRVRELAACVQFEGLGELQGIKHLAPLLRAIRDRREVDVVYRRFQGDEEKTLRIRPYLLKEYRGRWYVLCLSEGYDTPISLGLDRMVSLKVGGTRFKVGKATQVRAFYDEVIGVDASAGKAVRVVLRFTPLQGRYVKALPLHASQLVLRDDDKACDIAFHVHPNYELKQWILGQGDTVQVLEPKALAKEIKGVLARAVAQYR